jgi:hypothetical protein
MFFKRTANRYSPNYKSISIYSINRCPFLACPTTSRLLGFFVSRRALETHLFIDDPNDSYRSRPIFPHPGNGSEYKGVAGTVSASLWVTAELFGPGHFVGLGLRLKSEIRTRTRTQEIVTFLHLDPKLSIFSRSSNSKAEAYHLFE